MRSPCFPNLTVGKQDHETVSFVILVPLAVPHLFQNLSFGRLVLR